MVLIGVHDRLGSVRAVIDTVMHTAAEYTFDPFGKMYTEECFEEVDSGTGQLTIDNPFKYTGQYFDAEIDQYYVRARQYDPAMRRFTGRDPQQGSFEQTMSLHRYLYCWNNPTNMVDLNGKSPILSVLSGVGIRGILSNAILGGISGAGFTMLSGETDPWVIGANFVAGAVFNGFGGHFKALAKWGMSTTAELGGVVQAFVAAKIYAGAIIASWGSGQVTAGVGQWLSAKISDFCQGEDGDSVDQNALLDAAMSEYYDFIYYG